MKKLLLLLALSPAAFGAQTPITGVEMSNDGNYAVTTNLNINSGMTLSGTGTFDFRNGTVYLPSGIPFTSLDVTGTAGAGFLQLLAQSAAPGAVSGNLLLYADSNGKLAWMGAGGFTRSLDGTITASRTYTLPDASGTLITTGNLSGITTVGTITAGVWQGTAIGSTYLPGSGALTIGTTSISLGATATTIAGLTLSSPTLSGTVSLSGNTLDFGGASSIVDNGAGQLTIAAAASHALFLNGGAGGTQIEISSSGRLLINGLTTDSGNGALELLSSTSTSSGIAFGNDSPQASIYRSATSTLASPAIWDFTSTTASSSTTSGAVVISGGLGVAGTINTGALATTSIVTIGTASLSISGGTGSSSITLNGTNTSPEITYAAPSSATGSQVGHSFSFAGTAAGSATQYGFRIVNTVNQGGSCSFIDEYINRTQTAAGSGSESLAVFSVNQTPWYSFNVGNAATTGDFNGSSGTAIAADYEPNFSGETSTAGWTALKVNATDGSGSGTKTLISGGVGGTPVFSLLSNGNLSATGMISSGGATLASSGPTHGVGTWGLGTLRTGTGLTASSTSVLELSVGGSTVDVMVCSTTP